MQGGSIISIICHLQLLILNPGSSFLKAAKSGVVDNLQGNLDALAWGNCLPMGTGGQFDIIYSEKVEEIDKSVDVYGLLETSFNQMDQEINTLQSRKYSSGKCSSDFRSKNGGYTPKEPKQWKSVLRNFMTANDIQRLTFDARVILNKYQIDQTLSETDKLTIMKVLHFHPRRDEKFGSGPQDIKVGWHPEFTDSRCFFIIRKDGSVEDFSYRKCILGALDIIDPKKSKIQRNRWSGNGDMEAKKWSGSYDKEAKKWSQSYDKEAKKWSGNDDMEAKNWPGNNDVEVTSI